MLCTSDCFTTEGKQYLVVPFITDCGVNSGGGASDDEVPHQPSIQWFPSIDDNGRHPLWGSQWSPPLWYLHPCVNLHPRLECRLNLMTVSINRTQQRWWYVILALFQETVHIILNSLSCCHKLASSWENRLLYSEMLYEEVPVANNWHLRTTASRDLSCVNGCKRELGSTSSASQGLRLLQSQVNPWLQPHGKAWVRGIQLNHTQIPDPWKLWHKKWLY